MHRLGTFPERSLDIDVIFDLMIHDLDLLLTSVGSDVVDLEVVGVNVLTPKADIANARIRFASGCIANLTASRISREKVRKARFFQQDAYVSIDFGAREAEMYRLVRGNGRPVIQGGRIPVTAEEPLQRELVDFVHAVRERAGAHGYRRGRARGAGAGHADRRGHAERRGTVMSTLVVDKALERIEAGATLTRAELLELADSPDILAAGMLADAQRRVRHGSTVTYLRVATCAVDAAGLPAGRRRRGRGAAPDGRAGVAEGSAPGAGARPCARRSQDAGRADLGRRRALRRSGWRSWTPC